MLTARMSSRRLPWTWHHGLGSSMWCALPHRQRCNRIFPEYPWRDFISRSIVSWASQHHEVLTKVWHRCRHANWNRTDVIISGIKYREARRRRLPHGAGRRYPYYRQQWFESATIASQNGHLDVVRMLINSGIAVDIRNGTQRTPLALASLKGNLEVGRFLIERGADVNMRDNETLAPLHFASQHGHLDMARLLLNHGVDPNIKRKDLWSPLHLASANGHLKIAELLIQRDASLEVIDKKTPLYQAVMKGKVVIAHLLIDHGANLQTADSNGQTLLHAASQRGHLEVVNCYFGEVLMSMCLTRQKTPQPNWHQRVAKPMLQSLSPSIKQMQIFETRYDRLQWTQLNTTPGRMEVRLRCTHLRKRGTLSR